MAKVTNTVTQLTPELQKLANELLSQGKTVAVGEYRLTDANERSYMSKSTGKKETFSGVWHTVEIGTKAVAVQDRSDAVQAEGFDISKYESPFTKGEIVVVEVTSAGYTAGKGERTTGILHSLRRNVGGAKL
jgi:hypothetical protein